MIDKLKNNKAFTIIELIVVIAILGILVLLAVASYLGYTKEARIAQIKNDVKAHEVTIESEQILDSDYTSGWEVVDKSVLENHRSSNLLYDKRGLVKESEVLDDKYLLIPPGIVNTRLTGKFYLAKDGKVFYGEDGVSDGKSLISAGHDFFLYMNNGKLQKMTFESIEFDGEIMSEEEFWDRIFDEIWDRVNEETAEYRDKINEYWDRIESGELGEEKVEELYEKIGELYETISEIEREIEQEIIREMVSKAKLNWNVENVDTGWANNSNIIDIDTGVEVSGSYWIGDYKEESSSLFLLDDNSVYMKDNNGEVRRLIFPEDVEVEEIYEQEGFNMYVLNNDEIWYVGDNWYGREDISVEILHEKSWDKSEEDKVFEVEFPDEVGIGIGQGYLYILNSGEIWLESSDFYAPEYRLYVKLNNVYISDGELPSKRPWEVENDNTPYVNKIQSGHGYMFITRSDGVYALNNEYEVLNPIKIDIPNESIISINRPNIKFSFDNKLFITYYDEINEVDTPWSSEKSITHTDGYVYVLDDGDVYIGDDYANYERFSQLEVTWEGNIEKIVNADSLGYVGSYVLLDNNEIWFISERGDFYLFHKENKEIIDIDVNNYAIIMLFSNGEYKTIFNPNVYLESIS